MKYKYIAIYLTAGDLVSHERRKEYINSLLGDIYKQKLGMIDKFVKAIGYNDILADYVTDFPTVTLAKIKSPEDYEFPNTLLFRSLHIDLNLHGVVKFVVPLGKEEHTDSRFTYSHKKLCQQFVQFLCKVYPELAVRYEMLKDSHMDLEEFVLDNFYQGLDERIQYNIEVAGSRLLESDEVERIENVLGQIYRHPFKISQYFCSSCQEHDADNPYHIEIEYLN